MRWRRRSVTRAPARGPRLSNALMSSEGALMMHACVELEIAHDRVFLLPETREARAHCESLRREFLSFFGHRLVVFSFFVCLIRGGIARKLLHRPRMASRHHPCGWPGFPWTQHSAERKEFRWTTGRERGKTLGAFFLLLLRL